jgi:hypothetical protein
MKPAFMTVTSIRALVAGVLIMMSLVLVPLRASAGTVSGTVMHVSTTDLELKAQHGKTVRLLLVPEFDRVFSSDGKTTVQMARLKPGTPVTVQYTDTLGALRADKITITK